MLGTGPGEDRWTVDVGATVMPTVLEEPADAYLILASAGLDLAVAVAAARRNSALVALDGHSDEIRDPRWLSVLREVDVLFLNLDDAKWLAGGDALDAARKLNRSDDRVTVIKHGRGGLTAFVAGSRVNVGAFEIAMRDKVGAGDTLIGATLARRLLGDEFGIALAYGAAAAAYHIEVGSVPEPGHVDDVAARPSVYVPPETLRGLIYVAAPFFTEPERRALERVVGGLEAAGLNVASPSRDIGIIRADATREETAEFFRRDLAALDESVAVVALLDQDDTGTAWEVGYAHAKHIPVLALRTDVRADPNNMLTHSVTIARGMDELLRLVFRVLAT
jgi:nucleoside 2-deoxyribosyltransferase